LLGWIRRISSSPGLFGHCWILYSGALIR
jgi:hypothetical protein